MIEREMVTKGLECCESDVCAGHECPYYHYVSGCVRYLVKDALALLKAPEPMLMTPAELDMLPVGSVVWEEYLDKERGITELEPALKTNSVTIMAESGYTTIMDDMGDPAVNGNRWRWWSARPTDEQRKGAKWDQ